MLWHVADQLATCLGTDVETMVSANVPWTTILRLAPPPLVDLIWPETFSRTDIIVVLALVVVVVVVVVAAVVVVARRHAQR